MKILQKLQKIFIGTDITIPDSITHIKELGVSRTAQRTIKKKLYNLYNILLIHYESNVTI